MMDQSKLNTTHGVSGQSQVQNTNNSLLYNFDKNQVINQAEWDQQMSPQLNGVQPGNKAHKHSHSNIDLQRINDLKAKQIRQQRLQNSSIAGSGDIDELMQKYLSTGGGPKSTTGRNGKLNATLDYTRTPNRSVISYLNDSQLNKASQRTLASTLTRNTNIHQGSSADLHKALSTYLNQTGPGDYNLKSYIGSQIMEGSKRSGPSFSIKQKTKTTWFPENAVAFYGMHSPGLNVYSPDQDNIYFKKLQFSVGKQDRFFEENHIRQIKQNVPISYTTNLTSDKNQYKKIGIGYGQKQQYKVDKEDQTTPGPIYNNHDINSISYLNRVPSKSQSTFGNKYDKWDRVQYHGGESHFYGREGLGPGAYHNNNDKITNVAMKSSLMTPLVHYLTIMSF
eukprot:403346166